ncbi:adenylosuccinate lyase [Streptococcus sobrinus DSM 20742 = ATCC 33478]|nr:adenylosuccinate lyase [Streptococcus sobrinus DSM 20742 = ATCC 33478]
MINRYSRPEMANIWSEENKYRAWLEVEILADEAWAELGEIPKEDVALIREKADFDIDRILKLSSKLVTMWLPSHVQFLRLSVKSVSGFTTV